MKLLVATRNPGKFSEIVSLFSQTPIELVSLSELGLEETEEEQWLETADDFSENALAKARHFHGRSEMPVMAEDSGLRVDALDGDPGVRSKRFAPTYLQQEHGVDRANNIELLRWLEGVPLEERTAHFHCAVALVLSEDETQVFEDRVDGVILEAPRGKGGFGYDPLFLLPDRGVTTAMLGPEEKNEISHRGRAVRKARDWLVEQLEGETRDGAVQ